MKVTMKFINNLFDGEVQKIELVGTSEVYSLRDVKFLWEVEQIINRLTTIRCHLDIENGDKKND